VSLVWDQPKRPAACAAPSSVVDDEAEIESCTSGKHSQISASKLAVNSFELAASNTQFLVCAADNDG
jgi:hypothetical protein